MAVTIIANSNTLVSGDDENNFFQLGAPNIPPPEFVTIVAGAGNDTVNNCNGKNSVIDTGAGDNFIINSDLAENISIVCGAGNDSVVNNPGAKNTFIATGAGNDTIDIWSSEVSTIKFGGGCDVVRICADTKLLLNVNDSENYSLKYFNGASAAVTLTNGARSYTVRGSKDANIFDYSIPNSNLVIIGYGGEDLIKVDNPVGEASISGDDIIFPVGQGSITVKNAKAHAINLNGDVKIFGANSLTAQGVIKNFMSALDKTKLSGVAAVSQAIQACSNFSGVDELIDKMVEDCRRVNNADKFLRDYCNIIFDNADTGAITGWDAGTAAVKTAESVVDESGALKNFAEKSFVVNGLKINIPDNLDATQQIIINGLYTWWAKSALDLVEQSYGGDYRFDNPNASVNEMDVEFVNDDVSSLALVSSKYNVDNGRAVELTLRINMKYYSGLAADNVNGKSTYNAGNIRATYLDRTLAHEFTHAIMAANIDFFSDLPAYIKEGTAELTHGISDERRRDIETLAGDADKLRQALNPDNDAGKIFVEGVHAPVYSSGFMLLHYFAKSVAK